MQFRNDIQGLRAFAFIFVFLFHLNPKWLPGGFIGVDMFFVISGYLITSIILHQKSSNKFSFISFYESRIKRIVPAYYFALLLVAIAGSFIYLDFDLQVLRRSLITSAFFISNVYFGGGDNYFGAKLAENPLLHTWSLAIEMQFYLLLPILLILFRKKILPYIISLLIVIITAYVEYQFINKGYSSELYFSLLSRIPEFLIGSLFSIILVNSKIKLSKNINPLFLSIVGVLMIFYSIIFIDEKTLFPGITAFIPCIGVSLILISSDNLITKFLSHKIVVYIGSLSYSLYLWHWPIMAYIRYRNGVYEGYQFTFTEIIFITILTFVLAWISYKFVENTYRKLNNKKFLVAISLVALPLVTLTFFLVKMTKGKEIPYEFKMASFGSNSHGRDTVETIGSKKSKYSKIFLFGDSHANVIKPYFDYIGNKYDFSVKTLTSDSYPAIDNINKKEIPSNGLAFYDKSRKLVRSTLAEINNNDIIILNTIAFEHVPSMKCAVEKIIKSLRPDQKFILVKTFPILDRNPLRINRGIIKNSDYNFKIRDNIANNEAIEELKLKYPNIIVLDLSKSKVFDNAPYIRDTLIYYDDRHINKKGAIELAKSQAEEFGTILKRIINNNYGNL
ncbi:acyltransferase [Elizabethkingia anophelis]|nr:acyltransferase [Elizabethkingia anophelis]MCT4156756.1 acyltransferase [Elizabethkingia anophelis]MCT4171077.1 acyltransferase [Elizabethkingia anophelis]MCT4245492.1 acyltransferase [Elizabethkingia anophelis]MCT4249225.1 acyltransferase [Elizabethkingia anophelis]